MSQSISSESSPLRKTTLSKHVRRAARTLGATTLENTSTSSRPESVHSSDGQMESVVGNARKVRSQSTSSATLANSSDTRVVPPPPPHRATPSHIGLSGRRSTVSAGTAAYHGLPAAQQRSSSSSSSLPRANGDSTTMLRCPICGVMAPSLFALNVHLDDIHFGGGGTNDAQSRHMLASSSNGMPAAGGSHSEVVRSRYASQDDLDEVKGAILGFFRGAGKAVKGLSGGGGSPASPPENGVPFEQPQRSSRWRAGERDGADCDLVTRAHWQMMHPGARCSVPACAIELPLQASSALNCRCCGRLMCPQHCDRQVRLSDTAQPSPRGALCRCCDECYARAAGNHGAGQTRTLTAGFLHLRKKAVSTALLEGNRIEKRLEKLAYAHSSTLDGSTTGSSTLISAAAAVQLARARALQAAEQAVVVWEDDASVSNCPLCHKAFGMLSSRRHHCRLCGRVVCARPACSSLLSVPMNHEENSKGGRSPHSINRYAEIRACAECEHVVLRQRDRVARALQQQNPDELTRLYSSVREYMAKIEETLPTFNTLAMKLTHHSASSAGPPDISRAARIRKQLTMAFNNLDAASKRIVALPVSNKSYTRLQLAIRRSIAQYLQLHMFPLTMLPKPERPGTRSQSRASVVSMESISRPTRTPTPLRMQQSFGNGGGGGSANIADDDDVASLPSSMSTLNLETTPPSSSAPNGTRIAAVPFSMNQTSRSNSAETTTAAAAAAAAAAATNEEDDAIPTATSKSNSGIASSLLSFVKIAKPTSSSEPSEASVAMMQQEESIRQALLTDPGKRDRIAAMAQDEKIASLEVLRDQRQRVLGYISDAQKDRRIEDAVSLQSSLIDLDVELSLLERSL